MDERLSSSREAFRDFLMLQPNRETALKKALDGYFFPERRGFSTQVGAMAFSFFKRTVTFYTKATDLFIGLPL